MSRRWRPLLVGGGVAIVLALTLLSLETSSHATLTLQDHALGDAVAVQPVVLPQQNPSKSRPTFLWGIPTVRKERSQRELLRRTYLKFFTHYGSSEETNRICPLYEIEAGNTTLGPNDCQIAYVFFMGANPNGPTELVKPNASFPMVIPPQTNKNEKDLIHLNIKENMEDGKSQTWFKYGAMLAEKYDFDYIAKVDQDVLFFVPDFLDYVEKTLPAHPNNVRVYGGLPYDKYSCERDVKDHPHSCPLPLTGPYYFSGEFYYMSPDLAAYISSDEVDRAKLAIYHEDADIGIFVFSHPEKVNPFPVSHQQVLRRPKKNAQLENIEFTFKGMYWAHTSSWHGSYFKEPLHYYSAWKQYLNYHLFNTSSKVKFALRDLPKPPELEIGLVHPDDYIYSGFHPFTSPIVIESHKLVFFLQTETQENVWARLFRRMMQKSKWKELPQMPWEDGGTDLGLKFLSDYNISKAERIMTDPNYTRAIFVRDPKKRTIDIWDHSRELKWPLLKCCMGDHNCYRASKQNFDFFVGMIRDCALPYFRPSGERMEPKYFKGVNFVGYVENLPTDSEILLKRIGAWAEFGSTGWGQNGTDRIFSIIPGFRNETRGDFKYKKKTRNRLDNIYRSDYQKFNYTS